LRIPILLSLECAAVGSGANNLTQVLMQALMHERGLTKDLISKRLMAFGAKGVFVFQGTKSSVTKTNY
jgi:hypothetical protein